MTAALLTVLCLERGALAFCFAFVELNASWPHAAGLCTAGELQHLGCLNNKLDFAGVLFGLVCSGSRELGITTTGILPC